MHSNFQTFKEPSNQNSRHESRLSTHGSVAAAYKSFGATKSKEEVVVTLSERKRMVARDVF